MIYVKSLLAGLLSFLALVVLGMLSIAAWDLWTVYQLTRSEGDGIGAWSFNGPWIGLIPMTGIALSIILLFTMGFYRRFRRNS